MAKKGEVDEERLSPWSMAIAFAEVMLHAANNDEDERDPNKNILYYERISIAKLAGMSAQQRNGGVVSSDGNTRADGRTLFDLVRNPFQRRDLETIFQTKHSLEKIKEILHEQFDRPGEKNIQYIFKNWKSIIEVEKLIVDNPTSVLDLDKENAKKFASIENRGLHAVIRSYALNFFPSLENALKLVSKKSLLALGYYASHDFEILRKGAVRERRVELDDLSLLKDLDLLNNADIIIQAIIWLVIKKGKLSISDEKNTHYGVLFRLNQIIKVGDDKDPIVSAPLLGNIQHFEVVWDLPGLETFQRAFKGNNKIAKMNQDIIIANIAWALYELAKMSTEQQSKLFGGDSGTFLNPTADNIDIDLSKFRDHLRNDNASAFLIERTGNRFTRDAQTFIDLLFVLFSTIGPTIVNHSILPAYKAIFTELSSPTELKIIQVYEDMVHHPNKTIATYGMLKYVRGLLKPTTYIEALLKTIAIPGFALIDDIRKSVASMFLSVPTLPKQLIWKEGIHVEEPEQTGIYPLVVPSLIRLDNNPIINLAFDAIACSRGAVISLLYAIDADPKHHRLVKDKSMRVIDPLSLVLFINMRYRQGDMVYSPKADTGSTYAITIHVKKVEIGAYSSVPLPNYTGQNRFVVFDSKRFTSHEFKTPFDVDNFIFETLLPPLTHEGRANVIVRTPLIVFRAYRLKTDDDANAKSAYADPTSELVIPESEYTTLQFVSQSGAPNHGNACTSYSSVMAFFMFNGLGDVMVQPSTAIEAIAKQVPLFQKVVAAYYQKACEDIKEPLGVMTTFSSLPKIPEEFMGIFRIKTLREVFGTVRRCLRVFDHPSLSHLKKSVSEDDLTAKFIFLEGMVSKLEVVRGPLMQEISAILYSPLTIRYDSVRKIYSSRPFAIGITINERMKHSILLFVSGFEYKANINDPVGIWTKKRAFFMYDSIPGTLVHFDALPKFEEFILKRLGSHQYPVYTSMENFRNRMGDYLIDMNVYFTEDDVKDMHIILSEQYSNMGLYMENTGGQPPMEPSTSMTQIEVAAVAHAIDASNLLIPLDTIKAIAPLHIKRSEILQIKDASTASLSDSRSTPMSPTRVPGSASSSEDDSFEEIQLKTREDLQAKRKEKAAADATQRDLDRKEKEAKRQRIAIEKEAEKRRVEAIKDHEELLTISTEQELEEKKIAARQATLERKGLEIKQQQAALKAAEERNQAVAAEKQRKKEELKLTKEEVDKLKREEEEQQRLSREIGRKKNTQELEIKQQQAETTRIQTEINSHKKNIDATQAKMVKMTQDIAANEKKAGELDEKIQQLEATKKNLENTKKNLLGQEENLAKNAAETAELKRQFVARLSATTSLNIAMREEMNILATQNNDLQLALKAQKEQEKQRKKEISENNAVDKRLQRENINLSNRIDKLRRNNQVDAMDVAEESDNEPGDDNDIFELPDAFDNVPFTNYGDEDDDDVDRIEIDDD